MKFENRIRVIISLVSLIFIVSSTSSDLSTSSQENEISYDVKEAFGHVLDEGQEEFIRISSLDFDKIKEAFGPSIDDAKEAFGPSIDDAKEAFGPSIDEAKETFGPISSFDEAKEALGPISSTILDEAKEALGPISPSTLDDAKEVFGPISPSTLDDAKDAFGPASSEALDKAAEQLNSFASWISQNKDAITSEAQKEPGSTDSDPDSDKVNEGPTSSSDDSKDAQTHVSPSSQLLDEAKQKIGSFMSFFTQNKEDISSSLLEEAQKEFGPISSLDIDRVKEALPPISPSTLDKAKDLFGPIEAQDKEEISLDSYSISDESQKEFGPISSSDLEALSPISSEEKEESAPVLQTSDEAIGSISSKTTDEDERSLLSQTKEEISSDSPSTLTEAQKELGPISSVDNDVKSPDASTPVFAPIQPSTFEEAKHAIGSISSKAMDVAKDKLDSISSFFSKNKVQISQKSEINLHSSSVYFDHDVALAIESLIKQAQSNSQLAIEEGNKLLSDATVNSSDTSNCMKKCMDYYESCNHRLNKAMEDLKARNAELLTDDVIAVEGEISACRTCFLENTENQSPFKDLVEATIKATRECLNVLDHSG